MLPLIIRVDDGEKNNAQELVFSNTPVHVGRNPLNELVLTDRFCSQYHGIIRFDDNTATFMDLGSTNGTDFDGRVLKKGEVVQLTPTSDLKIGQTRLSLKRGAAGQASRVQKREWTVFGIKASEMGVGTPPPTKAPSPSPESPPAPPSKPPPTVDDALLKLHEEFRLKQSALRDGIEARIAQAPEGPERTAWVTAIADRLSDLLFEPAFQSLLQSDAKSSTLPQSGMSGLSSDRDSAAHKLLETFVRSYVSDARRLESTADIQAFLKRLAEVLESFSSSFVELRRGHEQFAQEIAVRTSTGNQALARAKNAADLLKYLLDWKVAGTSRTQELMSAFVELMVHQVALLNGIREGVKAMLDKVGPSELDRTLESQFVQWGPLKLKSSLWLVKNKERWRALIDMHRQLNEEEQQLTSVVFGTEFARAYATVMSDSADAPPPAAPAGRRS